MSLYVSDADKNRIEREAEAAGVTVSTYLMGVLDQHWADADANEASERMDAEEKIERVANRAVQEIGDAARHTEQRVDDLAAMVARSGTYSIANFELLKYQHGLPEGTKTDALRVGSRRLQHPLNDHPDLLDGDDGLDGDQDGSDSLTVEEAENADEDDDDEEELSASERFFKDRGRSKEEAEKTRW